MGWLQIRNWDKWQTYRKDRQQPPWIKLHRALMRDPDWISLSDAQRGHVICLWMLAADRDGKVPDDPKLIQKMCFLEKVPDLKLLMAHGFIDATVAPECQPDGCQPDALEEKRVDKKIDSQRQTQIPVDFVPTDDTLSLLNANGGFSRGDCFAELPKFIDHHRAKGSLFRDHQAAFRTWVRKSREFSRANGKAVAKGGGTLKFRPEPPKISNEEWRKLRDGNG